MACVSVTHKCAVLCVAMARQGCEADDLALAVDKRAWATWTSDREGGPVCAGRAPVRAPRVAPVGGRGVHLARAWVCAVEWVLTSPGSTPIAKARVRLSTAKGTTTSCTYLGE